MRRRQYKPKLTREATTAARQVWSYLYPGEPFGRLRVFFSGALRRSWGDYGARRLGGVIRLHPKRPKVVATLVHEFTHHRFPTLMHGAEFDRIVAQGCERLGIEP